MYKEFFLRTNSAPNSKRVRNGEYRTGQLHPASSTTKTGHHEIAEILLKVALNSKNLNQSIKSIRCTFCEISIEFYSTSTETPFEKTIIINNYFYYYDIALRGLINSPWNVCPLYFGQGPHRQYPCLWKPHYLFACEATGFSS